MEAYQHKIKIEKSKTEFIDFDLKEVSLKNTTIELISYNAAKEIILEYEWLGTMATFTNYHFGIYFNINGKKMLGGALAFGKDYADNTGVWKKYGYDNKILTLKRGVTSWWTPKNTASYFISNACKWLKNNTEYRIITATTDPAAGEIGIIYQSLNWYYVGVMSGNYHNKKETKRFFVYINGIKRSSRWIRNKLGSMKKEVIYSVYPDAKIIYEYRKRRYFYFMDTNKNNKTYFNSIKKFIQPYPKKNTDIIGIIYMINNKINNKKYIGQTTRSLNDRINDYERGLGNEYLNNAINKYGWDNFEFTTIDNASTINELNNKEIKYIFKYESNNKEFGYNIESGGRNALATEETRQKLSKIRKGHTQTPEWIEKRVSQVSKKVIKLNKPLNKVLETYNSLADAGKNNNDNLSYSQIKGFCGATVSYINNDIIWCYEEDYLNNTIPKYIKPESVRRFDSLSNDELIEILDKYNNNNSIKLLAREYNLSFSTLNKYIINLNKPQSLFDENVNYIAICKKTGKEFSDYINKSGALTTHIKNEYPDFILESKFKRKQVEAKTGKPWYYNYFDFKVNNTHIQTKKCKYCNWETNDIDNKSGAYEKHLKLSHNIKLKEYIKQYPNDSDYFKKEIYQDHVECLICNKKFKSITNTHLMNVHNITMEKYKEMFGVDVKIISNETSNKLEKNAKNVNLNMTFRKTSKAEDDLFQFITELGFVAEQSKRKYLNGLEIDVFIPELNVGFEFNGVYSHTEIKGKKDKNYHFNKSKIALEKNIILYQIFEDEWELNNEIVKNKIIHILNVNNNQTIVHARKCLIDENINSSEKNEFLNENHIQGTSKSNITISAKYNDMIVAVMTFDNRRIMNKSNNHNENIYELTRFAIKNNIILSGIAPRLLKYFTEKYKPEKIISFADRRWTPDGNNNFYIKLGFTLVDIIKPEYWYHNSSVNRLKRYHKFGFGKTSLKKKYPDIYDDNKTEWEMMQELGYDRIWDCGKFKYELKFP